MPKKLVLRLTAETPLSAKDLEEYEELTIDEYEGNIAEMVGDIESDLGGVITSHDVRIVDTVEKVSNPEYTPDKVSMGMLEEAKGVHIHIKGEPGELEVEVVSDMSTKDMADLFIAILQDMVDCGAK